MPLKKNLLCEANTMDDLQFRRGIYADPHNNDDTFTNEMLEEINQDPAKKQFTKDIKQLDDKIAQAMNIPVPDDLANKLILRQALADHQQHKKKKRIHLAMAASVAFALGLTLNFLQFSSAHNTLGEYALAHIYHEQGHFHNDAEAKVSLASLNQKMATFGGNFSSSLGDLIFADYCRFDSIKSLHLVFQGKTDTVSVIVIPNDGELTFESNFNDDKLEGFSQQFKQANIIVVGDKNESLEQWQENLTKNLKWNA